MKEDFKIIAIRPLEQCNPDYSKVLKRGELYTFYNEYKIDVESDTITYKESVPSDLYDVNDIKINISAIVGKNGEGKSSLVELLFMAINNMVYKGKEKINTVDIIPIKDLAVDIYYKVGNVYKIHIDSTIKPEQDIIIEISEYKKFDQAPIKQPFEKFDFNKFFYTIGTNYSHYALNSRDFGPWIHNIFHKNDAYQAPIVVNPFRKDGIIDINNEEHLLMSRLMSVILSRQRNNRCLNRMLTEKQIASKVTFSILSHKVESSPRFNPQTSLIELDDNNNILNKISAVEYRNIIKEIERVFKYTPYQYKTNARSFIPISLKPVNFSLRKDIHEYVEKYIVKKVFSIALKYKYYNQYINATDDTVDKTKQLKLRNSPKYISDLFTDNSHITLKLKQAINFIKYDIKSLFDDKSLKNGRFEFTINKLSESIYNISNKYKIDLIQLIPPAIFKYDITLVDAQSRKNPTSFNKLSSGEKQLIYCVSSVVYHISNLNSVERKPDLIKYSNVNLVFEEIELYFHPDLQRQFIQYLIDTLGNQRIKRINGINIIFVTHSPFILSDIPSENIIFLKLKEDNQSYSQPPKLKTFGANVYDLLKNGFFMDNGFIGEFAKKQINIFLEWAEKKDGIEDEKEKIRMKSFIDLFGEPIIKNTLKDLYCKKNGELTREQLLEKINQLEGN